MRQIILADRYNTLQIINDEKSLWVTNLLLMIGVNALDLTNSQSLQKYGIEVWDHLDNGDVEILQNNILIGKWYMPKLIAKYNEKKEIYYEIHLDYDSILDNEFHSSGEINNG